MPIRRQLLVSVRNACEARLAHGLGVPWIDLKNPALGSLGCPDVATAREVRDALGRPRPAAQCQTSVALGELKTLDTQTAIELMQLFPIAKVGLAGLSSAATAATASAPASLSAEMLSKLDKLSQHERLPGQLVLAAYADHQRAAGPSPDSVIELARRLGSRYVLVDTFVKDGSGLFRWYSPAQLAALGKRARSIGAQLVVAGSLNSADWPLLCAAEPAIVGVRGGVCTADRTSELCPERIRQWLEWSRS